MLGRIDDRDPGEDRKPLQTEAGGFADGLFVAHGHGVVVHLHGRSIPSNANRQHLEQAALNVADELRVVLDPVDQHDVVAFKTGPVGEDGDAVSRAANLDAIHGGDDRRAHRVRGNAELGENANLAGAISSTVGPHGGQNAHAGAALLQARDQHADHLNGVGDPPRAHGDHHARTGLHSRQDGRALQLRDKGRVWMVAYRRGFRLSNAV